MLREGPIPVFVQGVLEYLLGLFFIAAPFLLAYDSASTPLGISITVGVLLLIIAAISDSPTGLVKQLPITAHVTIDFLLSIFLIAAPFILGFSDEEGGTPRNLFIAAGVLFLLITIGTRFREGAAGRAATPAPAPSSTPPATRPAPVPAPSADAAPKPASGSTPAGGSAPSGSTPARGSTPAGSSPATGGSRSSGPSPLSSSTPPAGRTPSVPPPAVPADQPGSTKPKPPTP